MNQAAYGGEAETRKSTNLILSTDQLEVLQELLSQTKVTELETTIDPNPVVSLAKQGTPRHTLISFKFLRNCWIIDTSTSDHMTNSLKVLSSYEPCDHGITISMANGTTSMARGKGTANVVGLILESVLYVPDLKCNLLSMSKLTKDKSCLVKFFSYCEFQDLSSGKTIGNAEEKRGLYYISMLGHSLESRSHIRSSLSTISDSKIMLWHQRLGHPSFDYLKVLYPSLSINKRSHFFSL